MHKVKILHYQDLTPYRVGKQTFQELINIGWLDSGQDYTKGIINHELLDKLRLLTLFDLDQVDLIEGGRHHPSGICVHTMRIRGNPFLCPFCNNEEISLFDVTGRRMTLGRGEMSIPDVSRKFKFSFPTMLIHYIEKHNYLPQEIFLKALAEFPLNEPYDCETDNIC
jgi:hypothetical protein